MSRHRVFARWPGQPRDGHKVLDPSGRQVALCPDLETARMVATALDAHKGPACGHSTCSQAYDDDEGERPRASGQSSTAHTACSAAAVRWESRRRRRR